MKKILGLDLGTSSIGWALVNQAEKEQEHSEIIACGSRIVPLSSDEKDNFEKGKAITTNADRRLKRSMRRNLQRRKQRRDNLINLLVEEGWINANEPRTEQGSGSTHETLFLRAKAVTEAISLHELARVLIHINSKRGYKSSRKTDTTEDGQLIDGMQVAKDLNHLGLTPAEYSLRAIKDGQQGRFEFYRSDLEAEYDTIWNTQLGFYPDILTDDFKRQLSRQGRAGASKLFLAKYGIYTADNKGKERRIQALKWRAEGLKERLEKEVLAFVLSDMRGQIQSSSGYLGGISDRSKELYFNNETVGQYLVRQLSADPLYSTRNKVFYRQDYLDEFNRIWNTQAAFHPELTEDLRRRISERIIFYQRPLKSQKGLVSFCEFESHPIEVMVEGKKKVRLTGSRVAPRSSLLFQEFKIWQGLNHLVVKDRLDDSSRSLTPEEKSILARELNIRVKMKSSEALKFLSLSPRRYEFNFKEIEGNSTMTALFSKYLEIVEYSGHGEYDLGKNDFTTVLNICRDVFPVLGCNADIFHFDPMLDKEEYEQQPAFRLWHLLYSYEGDKSNTGMESLIEKISELTGLDREYAKILSGVSFLEDYASLSHKAMRKILPFLMEGHTYDEACRLAGYNHSHSMTSEDLEKKVLADRMEQLSKGALRNPVVEKILNQMVNVVNAAADVYGKPDEIHVELARELKKSAKERESADRTIQDNAHRNEEITRILQKEFNISYVKKSDILRYRLYDELKENGYKTLYSNKYIPKDMLFSKDIDIEHIIPQALLFDDSFGNKTLEFKDINIEKGRKTANDYVKGKYGDEYYSGYRLRVDDLRNRGAISEKKRKYLLMAESEIPSGFIDRDLRNSQYIARKSREMLQEYVRVVVPTTGSVTDRLREDWQLVDVMKELNFPKYEQAGMTFVEEKPDGERIKRIEGWTKRNDHRHHAMDAITIAFTKSEHIQILNNLNAKSNKDSDFLALYRKEVVQTGTKSIFAPPMPLDELRREAKRHLEGTLVSIKAKNKVVTRNVNKIAAHNGVKNRVELTPRGALHKEQVYGLRKEYVVSFAAVGPKMTEDVINSVASPRVREALRARLKENGGDPKKAFSGKNAIDKSPIWLDTIHAKAVPQKVKCVRQEVSFSIRKDVAPDLSVDKVMDARARARIQERIDTCGGNIREALSNLELNPIWLDDAHTIPIKRVTIRENFNLLAIHDKRDKDGTLIHDAEGNTIPTDFVNLRNNHHVALYKDAKGQVQEVVVPLFEALNRVNQGAPIVDRSFNHDLGWTFLFSMKVNEMFVFPNEKTGFDPADIDLTNPASARIISPNLFRVQKLSSQYYVFRHHQETTINDDNSLKDITWKRVTAIQKMERVVKVRINHLGQVVGVGEYD